MSSVDGKIQKFASTELDLNSNKINIKCVFKLNEILRNTDWGAAQ